MMLFLIHENKITHVDSFHHLWLNLKTIKSVLPNHYKNTLKPTIIIILSNPLISITYDISL